VFNIRGRNSCIFYTIKYGSMVPMGSNIGPTNPVHWVCHRPIKVQESHSSHGYPVIFDLGLTFPTLRETPYTLEGGVSIVYQKIMEDVSRVVGLHKGGPVPFKIIQKPRLPERE
jgi:hypothetical protein